MVLQTAEHWVLIQLCPLPVALPWAGNSLSKPVSFSVQRGHNYLLSIPAEHEDQIGSVWGTSFGDWKLLYTWKRILLLSFCLCLR